MKLIKSKKGVALLAMLVVAAVAAFGAYAFFTSTGHGSGAAKVGSSTAFTIASDPYTGGALTPAGGPLTYESVKYRVTNPSSGAQNLNQAVVSVAGTALDGSASPFVLTGGTNPNCTKGDFQLSVDGGTTWGAAGASVTDTSIAANLAAGATSAEGADVPLYFAAS
jgi:hypothetical protein